MRPPAAARVGRSRHLWALLMRPVAVATDAFLVVGIRVRTTHRIEAIEQTAKIPALWRRFCADDVSAKIPDRLSDPAVIAVYADYENDDRGPYSLLIGHKVRTLDQVPQGMAGVRIPAARYLCFTAGGPAPAAPAAASPAAWQEVRQFFECSHEYERGYTADYEVHRSDEVDICIAVK